MLSFSNLSSLRNIRQRSTILGDCRIFTIAALQITLGPSNCMLECCPTTPQDYPEKSGFAPRRERECGHRRHWASATGWQRPTVRGVFSGTFKRRLGPTLGSAKEERGRVYRIGAPANP